MKIHASNANLSDRQSGVAGCFHRGACAATVMLALTAASLHAQEWLTISAHLPSTQPTLVCFSPDGKLLATNGDVEAKGPGGMRLWDAKSGKMLLDITTWNSRTTDLGTFDLGAYRYRLVLRERWREELGHCTSVAFTPDGMTLAWGNRSGVNAWNGRTGKFDELKATKVGASVGFGDGLYEWIAFSADGLSIASAGTDYPFVVIWDTRTGIQRNYWQAVPSGGVRAIAFSPKGPYLAVIGCEDPRVHVWDLKSGKLRRSFGAADDNFRALAFSRDGKWLAAAGKTVRVWNWSNNREVGPLDGFEYGAQCVAFLPRPGVLLAGSRDGNLRGWDLAAEEQVLSRLAHSGENKILVVLPGDKHHSPAAGGVTSLAFSPDAKNLATAGWDGQVKLWDMSTLLPSAKAKRPRSGKK